MVLIDTEASPLNQFAKWTAIIGAVAFVVGFGGVGLYMSELIPMDPKTAANFGLTGLVGFLVGLPAAAVYTNSK